MKKFNLIALSLSAMFLLTGCGKTLTCTRTEDQDGIEVEQEWKVKYNSDDEITKVNLTAKMELTDKDYEDEWEDFVDEMDEMIEEAEEEDEEGIKISSKGGKKTYEMSVKIDAKKAKNSAIDEFYDHKMDIEELEEYLEELDYKCK